MSKIAVSLDNSCLICLSYKWKFQCIWISILNVEVIDKSGPPDSRPTLPVEKLYIYRTVVRQMIDMLGFVWNMNEDFAWDFPNRWFLKSSSKYLSSDSWIYIKQVHVVYVTHYIMIIFLLLIAIVVCDEVGENLWRVYRGSKSQLPFILHLAEL